MENRLIHDDCFNIFPTLSDNSVDLVVTDIPFNEVNGMSKGRDRYKGKLRGFDKGFADSDVVNLELLLNELKRICSKSIYIFCGQEQLSYILQLMKPLSTRTIVWEKTNPSPMNGDKLFLSGVELCAFGRKPKATFNAFCKNTVFKNKTVRSKLHPTEKPQELLTQLIKISSNEGDLILDPFAGSGSTGLACLNNNRNYICIEKNKDYFEKMQERIKQHQPKLEVFTHG